MANTYWQIAAGADGRNYTDYFIKYGMAFVGGKGQIATMREVEKGNIVVLKQGLSQIVAAGEVVERDGKSTGVEDKLWLRDIDGWDLPAYCYVDWHIPKQPIKTDGLTINTIQKLPQSKHQQIADDLLLLPVHNHDPEPSTPIEISDDQLLEHLITGGLRVSAAADLTTTIHRIRLLAKYYYKCTWKDVREHETRSFLVVPLLLALGWSEQQLKIELPCRTGKIDIACFPKPFKNKSEKECILIVETKGFTQGLDYAPQQAQLYAQDFPSCRGILVTNGYCYKAYIRKEDGSFDIKPSAYLNLLNTRDKYPLDPMNVDGALKVFDWLLPFNIR
jgi:hypothetical protein